MKKILIIEDDNILRNIYTMKLGRMLDADVHAAVDGEDGLVKLLELHPTVVLLDIIMPKKNGFEVLAEIRKRPGFEETPVVVFSVLAEPDDRERAFKLGANEYLIKHEISLSQIVDTIKKYL